MYSINIAKGSEKLDYLSGYIKVKVFGDAKDDQWHNMLIFGDNLQILKTLLKMKEDGKLKNPDGSRGVNPPKTSPIK